MSDRCESEGVRSLSDLARQAMQRLIADGTSGPDDLLAEKLKTIDAIIYELNQKLQQLTTLLEEHQPAAADRHSRLTLLRTSKEEQQQC